MQLDCDSIVRVSSESFSSGRPSCPVGWYERSDTRSRSRARGRTLPARCKRIRDVRHEKRRSQCRCKRVSLITCREPEDKPLKLEHVLQQGRWALGLTSSVINAYTAKNRRTKQYQHEKPPIDLRRFSGIRLHPKTRAAGSFCPKHLTHKHHSLLARKEALLLSRN
jgi:hypothetical protein